LIFIFGNALPIRIKVVYLFHNQLKLYNMSKFSSCPNCGGLCDTTKGYVVRPSVIASHEYVCSLRCRDEYNARYNRKKPTPQVVHETEEYREVNPVAASILFIILGILGIAGIGLALAGA
jgi:hypothetical protein